MTGNQIKGKGFKGALRYNLEKVDKEVAVVLDHSFASISEKSILKEVQMIRVLRPNLQKYFYHTSINFPPSEDLPNGKMKEIGQNYLEAMGFNQHQFIMFRHFDADHPHLHILVNRIGYDGNVISDSNDFARSEKVLRDLEIKHRLTQVVSSKVAHERAMTKNELEMMKRTNTPSVKMKLQVLVKDALKMRAGLSSKITTEQFIQMLESKGVHLLFNQASTGHISGISYSHQGLIVKGGKLGNDFKWNSIKSNINYEQERDRGTIHQANARTRSLQSDARPDSIHPEGHPEGDSTTLYNRSGQQQATTDQHENSKHGARKHRKTSEGTRLADQRTKPKADRNDQQTSQDPNKLNLAALLDGNTYGNLIHADHQPDLDAENALGFNKRKKKRRRPRI